MACDRADRRDILDNAVTARSSESGMVDTRDRPSGVKHARLHRLLLAFVTVSLAFALVACPTVRETSVLRIDADGVGVVRVDDVERSLPYLYETVRGRTVILEAIPGIGHTFAHWENDLNGSGNPTSIVVDGNRSVRAVFVPGEPDPDPSGPDPGPDPTDPGPDPKDPDPTEPDPNDPEPGPEPDPEPGPDPNEPDPNEPGPGPDPTEPGPDRPHNDDFAERAQIDGLAGSVTVSNTGATKQPGEPDHAGEAGGRSVWWTWTAPADVTVEFDASASDFDVVVAVYEGSTLTGLMPPAGVVETNALGSALTLAATAGTAYQLAVDGRDGAAGTVALTWSSLPSAEAGEWTVEPSSLTLVAALGGDPAAPAQVVLRNDGDAEASFAVSSNRTWLDVAPSSGSLASGDSIELTVSANACTSADTASGLLTVSGGDATATLTVERRCEGAHWLATPASLNLIGEVGDGSAFIHSLSLRNDGTIAAEAGLSTNQPAWLSVDPTSATVPRDGVVEVAVSAPACTSVGLETGEVAVGGGGHAIVIPVTRDCRAPQVPAPIALSIDRVYVNQAVPGQDSAQATSARVPLIANRAGLLRVFATADGAGAASAQARFHYHHGSGPEQTLALTGPSSVPLSTSEGSLATTYDVLLPAGVVQAGLQGYVTLSATVDGQTIETRYPGTGSWSLDVRTAPASYMTLLPIAYGGTTPNLGNGLAYLDATKRMFPMADDTIDVHVSGTPLSFSGNLGTGQGWVELLYAVTDRHYSDPDRRHHYGVVNPGYTSGIAGIGWIGGHRAAVGWSYLPSGSHVAAHELGHNWGLLHAPCGVSSSIDPSFPYSDGGIGVWGYDLVAATLRSPSTHKDLMSYCNPAWVSDYHYRKVLDYRATHAYTVHTASTQHVAVPVLLVRGWVDADTFHLDPLMRTTLRTGAIPAGPYTFIAWDEAGTEVVRVAFDTVDVSIKGMRGFHLAVPLPGDGAFDLSRVRIEHRGRVVLEREQPVRLSAALPAVVTREPDGRVSITWDTRAYDALMVRDGPAGVLLGRDSTGSLIVWPSAGVLELLFSDGLNTVRELVSY